MPYRKYFHPLHKLVVDKITKFQEQCDRSLLAANPWAQSVAVTVVSESAPMSQYEPSVVSSSNAYFAARDDNAIVSDRTDLQESKVRRSLNSNMASKFSRNDAAEFKVDAPSCVRDPSSTTTTLQSQDQSTSPLEPHLATLDQTNTSDQASTLSPQVPARADMGCAINAGGNGGTGNHCGNGDTGGNGSNGHNSGNHGDDDHDDGNQDEQALRKDQSMSQDLDQSQSQDQRDDAAKRSESDAQANAHTQATATLQELHTLTKHPGSVAASTRSVNFDRSKARAEARQTPHVRFNLRARRGQSSNTSGFIYPRNRFAGPGLAQRQAKMAAQSAKTAQEDQVKSLSAAKPSSAALTQRSPSTAAAAATAYSSTRINGSLGIAKAAHTSNLSTTPILAEPVLSGTLGPAGMADYESAAQASTRSYMHASFVSGLNTTSRIASTSSLNATMQASVKNELFSPSKLSSSSVDAVALANSAALHRPTLSHVDKWSIPNREDAEHAYAKQTASLFVRNEEDNGLQEDLQERLTAENLYSKPLAEHSKYFKHPSSESYATANSAGYAAESTTSTYTTALEPSLAQTQSSAADGSNFKAHAEKSLPKTTQTASERHNAVATSESNPAATFVAQDKAESQRAEALSTKNVAGLGLNSGSQNYQDSAANVLSSSTLSALDANESAVEDAFNSFMANRDSFVDNSADKDDYVAALGHAAAHAVSDEIAEQSSDLLFSRFQEVRESLGPMDALLKSDTGTKGIGSSSGSNSSGSSGISAMALAASASLAPDSDNELLSNTNLFREDGMSISSASHLRQEKLNQRQHDLMSNELQFKAGFTLKAHLPGSIIYSHRERKIYIDPPAASLLNIDVPEHDPSLENTQQQSKTNELYPRRRRFHLPPQRKTDVQNTKRPPESRIFDGKKDDATAVFQSMYKISGFALDTSDTHQTNSKKVTLAPHALQHTSKLIPATSLEAQTLRTEGQSERSISGADAAHAAVQPGLNRQEAHATSREYAKRYTLDPVLESALEKVEDETSLAQSATVAAQSQVQAQNQNQIQAQGQDNLASNSQIKHQLSEQILHEMAVDLATGTPMGTIAPSQAKVEQAQNAKDVPYGMAPLGLDAGNDSHAHTWGEAVKSQHTASGTTAARGLTASPIGGPAWITKANSPGSKDALRSAASDTKAPLILPAKGNAQNAQDNQSVQDATAATTGAKAQTKVERQTETESQSQSASAAGSSVFAAKSFKYAEAEKNAQSGDIFSSSLNAASLNQERLSLLKDPALSSLGKVSTANYGVPCLKFLRLLGRDFTHTLFFYLRLLHKAPACLNPLKCRIELCPFNRTAVQRENRHCPYVNAEQPSSAFQPTLNRATDSVNFEIKLNKPDNSQYYLYVRATAFYDRQGKLLSLSFSLSQQASRFFALVPNVVADNAIFDWDIPRDTRSFSPNFYRMIGLPVNSPQMPTYVPDWIHAMVHPDEQDKVFDFYRNLSTTHNSDCYELYYRLKRADGNYFWSKITGVVFARDQQGRAVRILGAVSNINHVVDSYEKIRNKIYTDVLTGLKNRAYMQSQLSYLLHPMQQPLGIIFVDATALKLYNDYLSHTTGDRLLITLTSLLNHSIPNPKDLVRLSGDEFVCLIPRCSSERLQEIESAIIESRRQYNTKAPVRMPVFFSFGSSVLDLRESLYAKRSELLALKEDEQLPKEVMIDAKELFYLAVQASDLQMQFYKRHNKQTHYELIKAYIENILKYSISLNDSRISMTISQ